MTNAQRRMYKRLGWAIRERRRAMNMSQELLSRYARLERSSIANIEAGKQKPLIDTLALIGQALKTKASVLLSESDL